MTHIEEAKAAAIIQTIAAREKKTPEDILWAMQEALDAAWSAAWTPGNIHAQAQWQRLFGAYKPSVEGFIAVTADYTAAHQ